MNICFLIRSLDQGGAERQLSQLATDLKDRGHTVRVITFYPGGKFENQLVVSGVTVVCIGKRGRWDIIRFLWSLRNKLCVYDPDILYSYLSSSNVVAALLSLTSLKFRLVWGIRSSNMVFTPYGLLDRVVSQLERLLARIPQLTIANSKAGVANCVARGFPKERIVYVPNGIDQTLFQPESGARAALRRQLNVSEETALIGMIARYDPMKGIDVFLDAAKDLVDRSRATRFLLAGSGMDSGNPDLVDAIAGHELAGCVSLLGKCDDVGRVLGGLDVATLSSRFGEGFSNVIGEAMACGIPVVATDVGDSAVVVGDAGRIVAPSDSRALSEAWREVLEIPLERRIEIGAVGRNRIQKLFERRSIAVRTEKILEAMAER
jgi:glycosyltransferase involved in cell wall biosynthesis